MASCASVLVVIAAVTGASATAHAQEAVPPRVSVSIEGPAAVFLEERLVGEEGFDHGWRFVCVMPCRAVVTSSPYADHRIVDGTSSRGVVIREAEGASRVVRYERASAASTPLIVGGIVLGVGGAALSVAGVLQALSKVTIWGCGGDRGCEIEKEKNRAADEQERTTAQAMVGVGAALMIVGTVAVLVGALTSSSSVKLSSPGAARPAARVLPRAPTWARAELASPPHHTPLLQLQF